MKHLRILSLFLAVSFLFLFTSCHGKSLLTEFSVPEEFDESRTYEITFWAKNDTNVKQTRVYENAIRAFEKIYPNIKVTQRLYTDYSRIYNDVITNIPTNTTPNVCITYPDHIATYLTGTNTVVPLDGLFADEKYGLGGSELKFSSPRQDQMVDKFLDECVIEGTHYAVPFMRSTEACYINKTYVEKLGYEVPDILTWDYVWEVSEAAAKKDGNGNFLVNGQKVMIPFIYKSTDNMLIQMLHQQGAGYSDEKGNIRIFNQTTTNLLSEIASHVSTGAFSTFKISSYPANFLNAGQCIFAVDSTAGSTWMGSDAPLSDIAEENVVDFETLVRPIPQYDLKNPSMISQGPSVCVFNKCDAQEVLASWIFAQYLLTNEVQIAYSQTEGYVPVTQSAQNSGEYRRYLANRGADNDKHYAVKIDATKLLIDNVSHSFVTPVWNGSASLRQGAGDLVEGVCKGVRRSKTVDDAFINNLYAETKSLYKLDQNQNSLQIGGQEMGPLPLSSVILLCSLGGIWLFLIAFATGKALRKKKQKP